MQLVARRLADLRPIRLVVQMTVFTHSPIEFSMRRNTLDIGNRPVPDDSNAILDVLLMTDMTIDLIVRTLLPGIPGRLHQMARGAKVGVVFNIIVKAATAQDRTYSEQN